MNKIDIICLLDMSGSMSRIIEDARKGFNTFLNEQKESVNKINFSLLFFDTDFYMPYKNVDIKNVKDVNEKTYHPGGGTSLYDAMGKTMEDYLDTLGSTPKEKRADKTLFVILTDGEENSSTVYSRDKVKYLVTELREECNVEFIYLGTNQDACFVAESLGIDKSNSFNYNANSDGITVAYANISKATTYYSNNDVKDNLFQQ